MLCIRSLTALALALLLAACGGGGGDDEGPAPQFPPECQKDPRLCR